MMKISTIVRNSTLISLMLGGGSASVALAQQTPTILTASAPAVSSTPGGHGTLLVKLEVNPNFHINANKPNDPDLIPTALIATSKSLRLGTVGYPPAHSIAVSYETKPMLVYTGNTVVRLPFAVPATAKHGERIAIAISLSYQGCDKSSCYPPAMENVAGQVEIK